MEAGSDPSAAHHDFELFKQNMEDKAALKRAQADQRDTERRAACLKKQQESRLQLKRAALYLSMKPSISTPVLGAQNLPVAALTLSEAPSRPSAQALRILFVSVDVEAYEYDQKCVTEIGISTLDIDDLAGTGGLRNINWAAKIISKHFRIQEYGHLRNKTFVEGCPADFQFGTSQWIQEADARSAIQACFAPAAPALMNGTTKSVVLVAHNVEADIKYLQNLGLQPHELVDDILDTSCLYQALRRQNKQPALASVLLDLGVAAKYLHNAGNDAHYTLQAMLAMTYEHIQYPKSAREWNRKLEARIEIAIEEAEARVRLEFQGWESSEDDELKLISSIAKARERPPATADGHRPRARPSRGSRSTRRGSNAYPHRRLEGTLAEVAVQCNPAFQDINARPLNSLGRRGNMTDSGRPRGRGRGGIRFVRGTDQTM